MLSALLRESSIRIKPELSSLWKKNQHQHQAQRCEFSQKTRRKPKNLSSSKLTLTTKDRLRVPTTSKSTITAKPKPSSFNINAVDADLISERLSTRLQWARSNLRNTWYDLTGSSPQNPRPARASLEMDVNWWFWNLLLAVSPAVIIALYCEMVAKPQMADFYSEQEAGQSQQQRQSDVKDSSSSSSLWSSQLYSLITNYIMGQVSEETKIAVAQVPTDLPSDGKISLENEKSSPPASSSPAQIQLLQQVKELQQRLKEMEQEIDTSGPMMTTATPISQSNIRTRIQERETAAARSQPRQQQDDDTSSKKNIDASTTVLLYLEHAQRLVQDWASATKSAARHQEEAAKIQPKTESNVDTLIPSQDQSRLLIEQHQSPSNGSIPLIHADDVEISPTNGGTEESASEVPPPSSPSNSRTGQSSTKRQHWWTWISSGRKDGGRGE
jgi:hypothetical protein